MSVNIPFSRIRDAKVNWNVPDEDEFLERLSEESHGSPAAPSPIYTGRDITVIHALADHGPRKRFDSADYFAFREHMRQARGEAHYASDANFDDERLLNHFRLARRILSESATLKGDGEGIQLIADERDWSAQRTPTLSPVQTNVIMPFVDSDALDGCELSDDRRPSEATDTATSSEENDGSEFDLEIDDGIPSPTVSQSQRRKGKPLSRLMHKRESPSYLAIQSQHSCSMSLNTFSQSHLNSEILHLLVVPSSPMHDPREPGIEGYKESAKKRITPPKHLQRFDSADFALDEDVLRLVDDMPTTPTSPITSTPTAAARRVPPRTLTL
jgi:hypothetical protein